MIYPVHVAINFCTMEFCISIFFCYFLLWPIPKWMLWKAICYKFCPIHLIYIEGQPIGNKPFTHSRQNRVWHWREIINILTTNYDTSVIRRCSLLWRGNFLEKVVYDHDEMQESWNWPLRYSMFSCSPFWEIILSMRDDFRLPPRSG
jgi:hypothetical protein